MTGRLGGKEHVGNQKQPSVEKRAGDERVYQTRQTHIFKTMQVIRDELLKGVCVEMKKDRCWTLTVLLKAYDGRRNIHSAFSFWLLQ